MFCSRSCILCTGPSMPECRRMRSSTVFHLSNYLSVILSHCWRFHLWTRASDLPGTCHSEAHGTTTTKKLKTYLVLSFFCVQDPCPMPRNPVRLWAKMLIVLQTLHLAEGNRQPGAPRRITHNTGVRSGPGLPGSSPSHQTKRNAPNLL